MSNPIAIPAVSVTYAQDGTSTRPNALRIRPMQERAYQKRCPKHSEHNLVGARFPDLGRKEKSQ
jgi:hypothetical protein